MPAGQITCTKAEFANTRTDEGFGGEIEFSNLHLPAAKCQKCCAVTSAKHGKVTVRPMLVQLTISLWMPFGVTMVL